jgi:hypothetical protein
MSNLSFYENGKIYKIVDNTSDNIYIGSTCKRLCQRMAQHRSNYKAYLSGKYHNVSSFDILKNNSYDIILIESYPCNNKEELRKRERYYIESMNCCNKNIPMRTQVEYREDNIEHLKQYKKEYQNENKEKLLEYQKEYQKENKEKILEYQKGYQKEYYESNKVNIKKYRNNNKDKIKDYYENNKDKIKEQKKEYYKQNIDKIKENSQTKISCVCGSVICKHIKARHEKTKKHTDYILKQTL